MNKSKKGLIIIVAALAAITISTGFSYAEFPYLPQQVGNETYEFVGKQYQKNSECEMMVMQYVLAAPYDYKNKVAPYMLFTQDRCDSEKIPNWTQCPVWINKDLGFCNNITE